MTPADLDRVAVAMGRDPRRASIVPELRHHEQPLTHARPDEGGFPCGLSLHALAHVALYSDEITCPACWAAEKARAAS